MTNKGGVGIPGQQKGVSTRDNDYKLDNFSLGKETYKKIFKIKAAGEQNKDGKQLMKIQKNTFKRWLKSFMDGADDKKIDVHVLPRVGRLANCKSSYPRHPCEVTQRWPYNKLPFDKVRTSRENLIDPQSQIQKAQHLPHLSLSLTQRNQVGSVTLRRMAECLTDYPEAQHFQVRRELSLH